jgi:hypothetical protein
VVQNPLQGKAQDLRLLSPFVQKRTKDAINLRHVLAALDFSRAGSYESLCLYINTKMFLEYNPTQGKVSDDRAYRTRQPLPP